MKNIKALVLLFLVLGNTLTESVGQQMLRSQEDIEEELQSFDSEIDQKQGGDEIQEADLEEDKNREENQTQHKSKLYRYPIMMYTETVPFVRTSDHILFHKQHYNSWTTMRSAYPLKNGEVSVIKIYLNRGNHFMLGCLQNRADHILRKGHIGKLGGYREFAFYTRQAHKEYANFWNSYGQRVHQGQYLTMKVDLRPGAFNIEYFKNDRSLGIAYVGLNNWSNVYLGISFYLAGQSIKIVDFYTYK